jgi:hypothetical protein
VKPDRLEIRAPVTEEQGSADAIGSVAKGLFWPLAPIVINTTSYKLQGN